MSFRRTVVLAIATLFFFAAAALAAVPDPAQILSAGSQIFARFIGHSSALRAELWYFGNRPMGPGAPSSLTFGQFLFSNFGDNSVLNGASPVSPTTDLSTLLGGPYAPGTQLYFGLFVQDAFPDRTGNARNVWFFSGPARQNPDSTVHALVADTTVNGTTIYTVSFEDMCAQDSLHCDGPAYIVDWDYNDLVFVVYTTPEPATFALMGGPLLGLAGLARLRRRRGPDSAAPEAAGATGRPGRRAAFG